MQSSESEGLNISVLVPKGRKKNTVVQVDLENSFHFVLMRLSSDWLLPAHIGEDVIVLLAHSTDPDADPFLNTSSCLGIS